MVSGEVLARSQRVVAASSPELWPMLIDGEWVQAAGSEAFDVFDPGRGEVIATVAAGGQKDVDAAVAAAAPKCSGRSRTPSNAAARTSPSWKA